MSYKGFYFIFYTRELMEELCKGCWVEDCWKEDT